MRVNFISVRPQGFRLSDSVYPSLRFRVSREGYARKHRKTVNEHRQLACFSSNATQSQMGTLCRSCANIKHCQLKLRLYFKLNDIDCCLELLTSFQNYRQYKQRLLKSGQDVQKITTRALVKNKGYWGEVMFSRSDTEND